MQWGLAAAVLLLWMVNGRSLADLGLRFESGVLWWVGAGLTLLACAYLVGQVVVVYRNPRQLESIRSQIESLRPLLPQTRKESRWFTAISVTAGICEELLFRGYLLAYMSGYLGIIPGVLISSAVFGLGHVYQGPRGVLKTGGVGLILAGLYLLTGSLWAPILLHAVTDVTSGFLARRALEEQPGGSVTPVLYPDNI
jgi:membrane protease YdiL (CAAX protease family)